MGKILEEAAKQREEIQERLNEKNYLATVWEDGDKTMSLGDYQRQVFPQRYYKVVSLKEIQELIKGMQQPWWRPKTGFDFENCDQENKEWGRTYNLRIEPLNEEFEKEYVDAANDGFFEVWRDMQKDNQV